MIENKTKFTVCDHDELIKKGWNLNQTPECKPVYTHPDFGSDGITEKSNGKNFVYNQFYITWKMIEDYQGQTLTVSGNAAITYYNRWYYVEENNNLWPVAIFLGTKMNDRCLMGVHFTGMTPIDGWFICKHCGTNLREIK